LPAELPGPLARILAGDKCEENVDQARRIRQLAFHERALGGLLHLRV
jgi:hypothetical protein